MFENAPTSVEFKKRRKRLARLTEAAITTYGMRVPGPDGRRPRWMICLSGGKDSYALLWIIRDLIAQGRLDVDLLAVNLDQAQPGFPADVLPTYLTGHGIPHRIERRDTYSIVKEKTPQGATMCALCSRLRRGHLYRIAREEACDAVVLGHHRDDILETFFLNLFYGGRLEAMPPKLLNEEGDLLLLRPLAHCAEADLAAYTAALECPLIPCTLCGSQDGLQRQAIKHMLDGWEARWPGRRETMLRALTTVRPGHLADPALFDFAGLAPVARPASHP